MAIFNTHVLDHVSRTFVGFIFSAREVHHRALPRQSPRKGEGWPWAVLVVDNQLIRLTPFEHRLQRQHALLLFPHVQQTPFSIFSKVSNEHVLECHWSKIFQLFCYSVVDLDNSCCSAQTSSSKLSYMSLHLALIKLNLNSEALIVTGLIWTTFSIPSMIPDRLRWLICCVVLWTALK